jgi:hypothetical protein
VESLCIGPVLNLLGGERRAAIFSAFLLAPASLLEIRQSFSFYLTVLCPAISLSVDLMGLSLRSLVTRVAPEDSIASVLAALDVLQNAVSVTVPFYRTLLFAYLASAGTDDVASMKGDPPPVPWIISSSIHWVLAGLAFSYLVLTRDGTTIGFIKNRCEKKES